MLDSPADTEHTVLTKDVEQVTAVGHSVETEAWLCCVKTIRYGEDTTQEVLCLEFSH